eukprot:403337333
MGFFKKIFQIITCGIGPWIWDKIKQKLGFAKWTLRWQIFCSVSCSLFCVLVILIAVIAVNLNYLVDSTYEKLDSKISDIYSQNLNDLGLQFIIYPVNFSPYPLNVTDSKIYSQNDVVFNSAGLSYDQMVYYTEGTFAQQNQLTQQYIRQVSVLSSFWKKLILTRLGKDSDINISRFFIMLQANNTQGLCQNVLFLYPAQQFVSLGAASQLGGCTNQMDQFQQFWTTTLKNDNFTHFPKDRDPFGSGVFGDVSTYTRVLYNQGKSGSNQIGIIGLQYQISMLQKLIAPLVAQDPNTYFLVYKPDSRFYISQTGIVTSNIPTDFEIPDELLSNVTSTLPNDKSFSNLGNIKGEMYRVFRCLHPTANTENPSFVLIMLQSITQTSGYSTELYNEIQAQFRNLLYIVFGCSILLFFSIWILILRFTKKITHPIRQLTRITEIIKQATGREGREKVLSVIENEPIFEKTKRLLRQEHAISESRRGTMNQRQTMIRKETRFNTMMGSSEAMALTMTGIGAPPTSSQLSQSLMGGSRHSSKKGSLHQKLQSAHNESLESMDEIQELLKIFYKFFVGARNKPRPSNEENMPKYYKNNYYQPYLYPQSLADDKKEADSQISINKYVRKATSKILHQDVSGEYNEMNDENFDVTNIRTSGNLNNLFEHSKVYPNINESLLSNSHLNNHDDEKLLINGLKSDNESDEDSDNDKSHHNIDGLGFKKVKNVKKSDIPMKISKPTSKEIQSQNGKQNANNTSGQFSFARQRQLEGGTSNNIHRSNNIEDASERVRVTIPIDWDEIIDKYIDQITQNEQQQQNVNQSKKSNIQSTKNGNIVINGGPNSNVNNTNTANIGDNYDSDSDY